MSVPPGNQWLLLAASNMVLSVAGITGRFGEDIFDRLKKEKSIQAHDVTASSGPDGWTLTEEVRSTSNSLSA